MRIKILAAAVILLLTGYTSESEPAGSNPSNGQDAQQITVYSGDLNELKDMLNACPNFQCSDDLTVSVPEQAELYEFTVREHHETNFETFEANYQALFQYVFPDREMSLSNLHYTGSYTYDDDFEWGSTPLRLVSDYRAELVSGAIDYDGLWYDDPKDKIYYAIGSALDHGNALINRGVTQRLTGSEAKPDNFYPQDEYTYLKTVSPDSTEKVKLLNGETTVQDAVAAFSAYIDKMPYPKEQNVKTAVHSVEIYQVNSETCGLLLRTTPEYCGLQNDYWSYSSYRGLIEYNFPLSYWAWMIETDKPDEMMACFRYRHLENVRSINKIADMQTAVRTISDNLSAAVTFDVLQIEFVYQQKYIPDANGHVDLKNGQPCTSRPVWKFTLQNPNDTMMYVCWLDAETASDFEYICFNEEAS